MHTRTVTTLVAAVALLLAPTGAAQIIDYVDNGGFETFDGDDPADWRVLAGNANPTSDAAEGDKAVVLNFEATETEAGIAQNVSLLRAEDTNHSDPPTLSGTWYEVNFSAKLGTGEETVATNEVDSRAVVIWKNLTGEEVARDEIDILQSDAYQVYTATLQAPGPHTGDQVVVEAEIQFHLERSVITDRTDANLFVDAAQFGPTVPPL